MGIIQNLLDRLRGKAGAPRGAADINDTGQDHSTPEPLNTPAVLIEEEAEATVREPAHSPATRSGGGAGGIKKVVLDEAGLSILDLRELPSSRSRIVGSSFWVTDSGRSKHGGSDYLLVREPKNKWDANAVAVYGKGRKVGHLSEAKAAAFAPILDELPFDAYRVGGVPPADNSIRMWVDLPAIPKLRTFVKTVDGASDK